MPEPSKRQRTHQQILNAAWQLFREQGYQDTSTRQIARAAGVADGTVFSHFATKLELLQEGMRIQIDQVLADAEQQDRSHSAAGRLLHFADYLYRFYLTHREFSRELLKEIIWQQDYFRPQLLAFRQRLEAADDHPAPARAEVMLDLYFMTLIQGLNHPRLQAGDLLATLAGKIEILGNGVPGQTGQ